MAQVMDTTTDMVLLLHRLLTGTTLGEPTALGW